MTIMAIPAARILGQRSHLVSGKLRITEHFFEVPQDYASPNAGTLRLFARSVKKHVVPVEPEDSEEVGTEQKKKQLPWLVYLQGGPGFGCRSPKAYPFTHSFLDKGYQMLYLDARGTGLSSPIFASTLAKQGDDAAQANYMKLFRADNIVRDCEAVRQALTADYPEKKKRWSLIGQSFGGFCAVSYISMFPQSVQEAFLTGGLPPLIDQPDAAYNRLFKRLVQRNIAYYDKFPEDIERVKTIVRFLQDSVESGSPIRLPSGGVLTPRRFIQQGISFGFHGGFDNVHDDVLRVISDLNGPGHLTRATLDHLDHSPSFDNNPIYVLLHEPAYCQGKASNWSADRVMREAYPGFNPEKTLDTPNQPTYFLGEMTFPWMLEDYDEMKKLANVANKLATFEDWPMLYDTKQLAANTVPVYAAVYMDDMYVDFDLSMAAAKAIKGCKTLVTNRLYHNAVVNKSEEVIEGLWKLRCDTLD